MTADFLSAAPGRQSASTERLPAEIVAAPERADVWVKLAIAEGRRKRFFQAVTALSRARALSPTDPEIHYILGRMLFPLKHYRRAEAAFAAALMFKREHAEAHFYLGRCLGGQSRFDGALCALEQAIALAPSWPAPASFSGTCFFTLNRNDEAAHQFLRAIALNLTAADVHFACGRALLRAGHRMRARSLLDRAVDLDPDLAKPREFLLLTLSVQDMKEDLLG